MSFNKMSSSFASDSSVFDGFNASCFDDWNDPEDNTSLLLFISHGNMNIDWSMDEPLDKSSRREAESFLSQNCIEVVECLYPDHQYASQNLQRLINTLKLLPSPLGMSAHPQYGVWWAFRALYRVRGKVHDIPAFELGSSPCLTCVDPPCISTCPANALNSQSTINLGACINYRDTIGNACNDQCIARNACPIAPHLRYSDTLQSYLQQRSYDGIKRWLKR